MNMERINFRILPVDKPHTRILWSLSVVFVSFCKSPTLFPLSPARHLVHIPPVDQAIAAHPGRESPSGGSHWFIWPFLFLLFTYPLSTGPVIKLKDAGVMSPSAVDRLYTPLNLLASKCPPFGDILGWYIFGVWKCHFPIPMK